MRLVKNGPLDVADHVAVFAHDLRQGYFSDLGKLRLAELEVGVVILVPESVALFELLKLNSDDAGEGRADESPLQRSLAEPAREEVDIIHVVVHLWGNTYMNVMEWYIHPNNYPLTCLRRLMTSVLISLLRSSKPFAFLRLHAALYSLYGLSP